MFFVLKKKYIIFVSVLTLLALFLSYGIYKTAAKQTFFKANDKTIIIDAGHAAQKKNHNIKK